MTKALSKAIMQGLKNLFNKYHTEENIKLYKKQRNYCVNLLIHEKKKYLDLKIFDDNRTFGNELKHFFLTKQVHYKVILL